MTMNMLNIVIHVSMGVMGLVLGLVPLLSHKGGRLHRRFGRWFVRVAGVALVTALLADVFLVQPVALLAASLAASYQYVGGLRSLRLRTCGPTAADGLFAVAALVVCGGFVLYMRGNATASWSPMIGYSTAAYVAALALYDLSRPLWAKLWLQRIRPLDHGLKMTGCYFAMLSAGAGNVLRGLQPWSQLLPSTLGMGVMLLLAFLYFRSPREAAPLPVGAPQL